MTNYDFERMTPEAVRDFLTVEQKVDPEKFKREWLHYLDYSSWRRKANRYTIHDEYYNRYLKGILLEKSGFVDDALELYLLNFSNSQAYPDGTVYYERPCIILERKKRYQEAIKLCKIAIRQIKAKKFHADAEEFEKRKARLEAKLSKSK